MLRPNFSTHGCPYDGNHKVTHIHMSVTKVNDQLSALESIGVLFLGGFPPGCRFGLGLGLASCLLLAGSLLIANFRLAFKVAFYIFIGGQLLSTHEVHSLHINSQAEKRGQ